jgi:DNA-binding transcriptional ArsR family regulator
MGVWLVGADALARSRFAISPMAETVATLLVLRGSPNRPGQLTGPAGTRAAFRRRLAGDPVGAAFVRAAVAPRWVADFLCTPPADADRTFADELRRIRSTTAAELRVDLVDPEHTGRRSADPVGHDPALDAADLPDRVADVLAWVWAEAVEPDWPRRRRAFEADVVARTRRLSTGGWAAALDDMRPGMRWLGDGQLQINAYDFPPRDLAGARLLFVPTTTAHGWVGWDPPHRYSIVYPCTGLLAETRPAAPDALRRLIGPARATVLALLDAPMSTSQVVAVTGFALGSVGNHLKVLLDAGLVRRRRSGRSVLYFRTGDGDRLVTLGWRPAAAGTPRR